MRHSTSLMRNLAGVAAAAFVLGCSQDVPTSTGDLEIRAARASGGGGVKSPSVNSASPNAAKRNTTLDVRIFGSGFDRTMTARWAIDSVATSDVVVNSTRYVSSSELVANITVTADAQLAMYDIMVSASGGGKPGIGTETFEVVSEFYLGTLGGNYTTATAINDGGQIAGWSSLLPTSTKRGGGSENDRPVVWQNGVIRDLLPSGYVMGRALDINESGQVVGWVVRASDGFIVPFVWSSATGFRSLPTISGQSNSGAFAINDAGVVAGWSGPSAVIWENGVLRVIYGVSNQWATATDINSTGDVIGYYQPTMTTGPYNSFKWNVTTGAQPLSTLSGTLGVAHSINDLGQIVGTGPLPGGTTDHAFIIENGTVNRLSSSGTSTAVAISESGHVVGTDQAGRGILWMPDGTELVLCTPVAPAAGYTARCSVYRVNSDGVSVGSRTDKYGVTYKAYRWSLLLE